MRKSWTEQIREHLQRYLDTDDAESLNQLSISLQIPYASLYDFAKKQGGISAGHLESLGNFLGFRLISKREKKISEIR